MKQRKRNSLVSQTMTRREMLRLGLTATAGVAVGPFVVTPARAQTFNWQRFRGREVYVIFFRLPWTDAILPHIPEFSLPLEESHQCPYYFGNRYPNPLQLFS